VQIDRRSGQNQPFGLGAEANPAPKLDPDRYHILFNSIDEGFCIVQMLFDADGRPVDYRFLEINPAFERHTGLHDAEGRTMRELAPELERHWFEIYGNVATTGESVRFTNQASALEGRWFDVNAFRVGAPEQHLVGILFTDISQRKHLERLQHDFVAMTNHDLSAPISVVRARAQLMRRRERFDPEGLDAIIEQTRRMERMLSDLRQAIKAGAGWVELRRSEVDLGEVARAAAERARLVSHQHHISVMTPPAQVTGLWDRDRLNQVLDNLIGNAQKHVPGGCAIAITVQADDASARLSVADSGPGIPVDRLPFLFERFYRGDLASGVSGLGLGLYIVRMLVEAHGGRVWAESAPEQGTTIHIELPITPTSGLHSPNGEAPA